jgi:hypothetical protein
MPDELQQFVKGMIRELLDKVPAEQLLDFVPPEQRLAGLSPEEQLATVSPLVLAILVRRLKDFGSLFGPPASEAGPGDRKP